MNYPDITTMSKVKTDIAKFLILSGQSVAPLMVKHENYRLKTFNQGPIHNGLVI